MKLFYCIDNLLKGKFSLRDENGNEKYIIKTKWEKVFCTQEIYKPNSDHVLAKIVNKPGAAGPSYVVYQNDEEVGRFHHKLLNLSLDKNLFMDEGNWVISSDKYGVNTKIKKDDVIVATVKNPMELKLDGKAEIDIMGNYDEVLCIASCLIALLDVSAVDTDNDNDVMEASLINTLTKDGSKNIGNKYFLLKKWLSAGMSIIVGLALIVISVVMFLGIGNNTNREKADAIITSIDYINEDNYKTYVQFVVDDKVYNVSINSYSSNWKEGDKIQVMYNVDNPTDVVTQTNSIWHIILGVAGVIAIIIAIRQILIARRLSISQRDE